MAVPSVNGINTQDDREAINDEAAELTAEITRIAKQTTYGGKTILNVGGANSIFVTGTVNGNDNNATTGTGIIQFQVGANSGDVIYLTVKNFTLSKLVTSVNSATVSEAYDEDNDKFKLSSAADASATINAIDAVLKKVDEQRSTLGSIQNRLESSINVQSAVANNKSDAHSRIRDTDFAVAAVNHPASCYFDADASQHSSTDRLEPARLSSDSASLQPAA